MSWRAGRLTRRAFCEVLGRLSGVIVGSVVSIPLAARFIKDARVSGEARAALLRGSLEDQPSPEPRVENHTAVARTEREGAFALWMPNPVRRWSSVVKAVAALYKIDPNLIAVMVLCESGGSFCAVSPEGAVGLMQVKPFNAPGVNLFDPECNLLEGVGYLSAQYRAFGTWERAITAYHEGPGNLSRGTVSPSGTLFCRWVNGMWEETGKATSATYQAWLGGPGASLVSKAEELYRDKRVLKAVEFAAAQWDKPYLWAGEGPSAWDCSALVQAAYRHVGIAISRTATAQWRGAGRVLSDREERLPGDLVFFTRDGASSDHVGMILFQPYVFIEASGLAGRVRVSSLSPTSKLYRQTLAGRILGLKRVI